METFGSGGDRHCDSHHGPSCGIFVYDDEIAIGNPWMAGAATSSFNFKITISS